MTGPAEVIARRRRERAALIDRGWAFARAIPAGVNVRGVVVGSVARGDFQADSDVDVLVVAAGLPDHPVERLAAVGAPVAGIDAVVWTPGEWASQSRRGDPVAVEVREHGVWLTGSPADLDAAT